MATLIPNSAKLLLAVMDARGQSQADQKDIDLVKRIMAEDTADELLLATFVNDIYFPRAKENLRGHTYIDYLGMWTRYHIAEMVAGLRLRDFEIRNRDSAPAPYSTSSFYSVESLCWRKTKGITGARIL